MKVMLLQDVKKVGQRGSVIEVADGYAQNVLIPKKLAAPATGGVLKQAEHAAAGKAERQATDEALARAMLAKLDGQTIPLRAKASETGTLFVAIHERDVTEAIEQLFGYTVPESAIHFDGPIKKTGDHLVSLTLRGAQASIMLSVRS